MGPVLEKLLDTNLFLNNVYKILIINIGSTRNLRYTNSRPKAYIVQISYAMSIQKFSTNLEMICDLKIVKKDLSYAYKEIICTWESSREPKEHSFDFSDAKTSC